ncbi:MAG: phosphoribosylanthranilate isomerase [Candidatus Omnitrophica bacterium]|nr:phosphoribosylanthranilate isomerase [Candidatus Omnitrophota bacterium]
MTKIKICGITNLEDAQMAIEAGCDALGFIFAESLRRINIENASYILKSVPPFINCVAVFANQPVSFIKEVLRNCPFDTLQFHADENHQFILQFKPHKKIIKTIRIKGVDSLNGIEEHREADAFLLDTYSKESGGGTGRTFDWGVARRAKKLNKPIILSGGLNPQNVSEAIKTVKPYAVDVSSGVEEAPGKKLKSLIEDFILKVKKEEA